jgi:hypothetical protein
VLKETLNETLKETPKTKEILKNAGMRGGQEAARSSNTR